jgi:SnoaL-like domain
VSRGARLASSVTVASSERAIASRTSSSNIAERERRREIVGCWEKYFSRSEGAETRRRRAAIDGIFTEDCVFYAPTGVYRGRDEIDRVASAMKATHPDFQYQPIAGPEELGNGGRIQWVSGRPGEAPAYAGTDFIIARDGRIAAVYLFFDKLP